MRRILISKPNEFSYPKKRSGTLGCAIKQLANFFEGIEYRGNSAEKVTISGKITKVKKRKEAA